MGSTAMPINLLPACFLSPDPFRELTESAEESVLTYNYRTDSCYLFLTDSYYLSSAENHNFNFKGIFSNAFCVCIDRRESGLWSCQLTLLVCTFRGKLLASTALIFIHIYYYNTYYTNIYHPQTLFYLAA